MTNQRALELLNNIVEFVAIANDTKEQIEELTRYGFTAEELVKEFNYSKADVEDATGETVADEPARPYKLHARVTREIMVTEEQMERLCNNLCGCNYNTEISDITEAFTDGITSGDYEAGYIPIEWLGADFEQAKGEIKEYFDENQTVYENVEL